MRERKGEFSNEEQNSSIYKRDLHISSIWYRSVMSCIRRPSMYSYVTPHLSARCITKIDPIAIFYYKSIQNKKKETS